jgi:hypothetical protein
MRFHAEKDGFGKLRAGVTRSRETREDSRLGFGTNRPVFARKLRGFAPSRDTGLGFCRPGSYAFW